MVAVQKYSTVISQNQSEALELSFARCYIIIALTVPRYNSWRSSSYFHP